MKIWCHDSRDKFYTDAAMRDVTRLRHVMIMFGQSILKSFPKDAIIEIRSRRPPTDFFEAGKVPIVSAKLRTILDSFGVRAEYVPITLMRRRDGTAITGQWYCFNVMEVANCFDRTRSKYKPEQDYAGDIERLVIDEGACRGAPLVLVEKTIPKLLVVRDDLAAAIEAAKCVGVRFRNPEDWRDPVNPVN